MAKTVIKRDGRIIPFDPFKIKSAICKAFEATGEIPGPIGAENAAQEVLERVLNDLKDLEQPHIEQIQDWVEKNLISLGRYKTAKAYILYREQRRQAREMKAQVSLDLINHYLQEADWRIKENANVSFSVQGLHNYITGAVAAEYWLNKIYPPEIREAHKLGDFHLHDLGFMGVYCCGWDLQALLQEGFNGVSGQAEAGPPRHFRSALGQIYNFLYTMQNEAAGAQAFSSFDTLLAPFVKEDHLTYPEILQGMQEAVFNLNTPTRMGSQVPFTNVTLDVFSSAYDPEPVILNGKVLPYKYGDLQAERQMIARAFCEVMQQGDYKGRAFTFPVPTFNLTPQWQSQDLPETWRLTSKYGSPYFSNFISSDLRPEDVRSMCCRLRLDKRELIKRGGGLFGANPLTGSIGVVTLNLPRIAFLADNETDFFSRLTHLAGIAVASLEIKRKVLNGMADQGLYPFSARWLKEVKLRIGSYYGNHFSTLGVIGGNEMCLNLLGVPLTDPEGKRLAKKVLDFLREFCITAQEQTGNLYNLEATPAEGCSYRLAKLDKEKYPALKVANENNWKQGAAPYYTNSTQPPVGWSDDPFAVIEHQNDLQVLYTGGTVTHFWTGENSPDPSACREFILSLFQNSQIPYATVTPSFSICPEHGHAAGAQTACLICGKETEVWSRVTGYLRPVSNYNAGKQAEYRDRARFKVG